MAFDKDKLTLTLQDMKACFVEDRNKAIRGQNFIKMLHDFCVQEMTAREMAQGDIKIVSEAKILTSHKYKNFDVALVHPTSGPLVAISLRSQMSSLSKNFSNYYEMEVGDVYAMHERFPMCVVGLIYLHPLSSLVPDHEDIYFNFDKAEKMFGLINGREKPTESFGHYEEIAYMRVDFHQDPPVLDTDFPTKPNLRLDNFFDNIYQKFVDRNFHLLG